jgi:hypothetical protein
MRFNHHEQACAIVAKSYFRLDNDRAVVNITTRLRGTNAITGVSGNLRRLNRNGRVHREGEAAKVMLDENQSFAPKLSSRQLPARTIVSPSLEDLAPFLSRDELANNMVTDL